MVFPEYRLYATHWLPRWRPTTNGTTISIAVITITGVDRCIASLTRASLCSREFLRSREHNCVRLFSARAQRTQRRDSDGADVRACVRVCLRARSCAALHVCISDKNTPDSRPCHPLLSQSLPLDHFSLSFSPFLFFYLSFPSSFPRSPRNPSVCKCVSERAYRVSPENVAAAVTRGTVLH